MGPTEKRLLLTASLAAVLLLAPGARAEGPPKAPKGGEFPAVEEVTKEDEAKALLQELQNAAGGTDEKRLLAAVKPLLGKRHKSFVPDLKKLAAHRNDEIAVAAVEALGSQGDKGVAPLLSRFVTQEVRERGILQGGAVKAAAIESLGRLGVAGTFDPIRKLAESMLRDPELRNRYAGPILRASVRYFGLTKEKRAVSFLVEQVDEPVAENPGSGTNPPEAYWKARHEAWQAMRWDVAWALKEITGKEFETGRRWRNWLEDEGKKQGMK